VTHQPTAPATREIRRIAISININIHISSIHATVMSEPPVAILAVDFLEE
jgi:hypothetical protein